MIFSDMVSGKDIDLTAETQRHGPVNMLESLENPFSKASESAPCADGQERGGYRRPIAAMGVPQAGDLLS